MCRSNVPGDFVIEEVSPSDLYSGPGRLHLWTCDNEEKSSLLHYEPNNLKVTTAARSPSSSVLNIKDVRISILSCAELGNVTILHTSLATSGVGIENFPFDCTFVW